MEEDKSQPEKVPQLPVSEQEVQIEAPSFLDKLKLQKKKILIGLGAFFGFLILAGVVFSVYKLSLRQVPPATQLTPTPLPTETPAEEGEPTADWETYTSISYGFSIKYPEKYEPRDLGGGTFAFFETSNGEEARKVTIYKDFSGGWACTRVISSEEVVVDDKKANLDIHADLVKETCAEVDPKGKHKGVVSVGRGELIWLFLLSINRGKETEEIATFKRILSTFQFLEAYSQSDEPKECSVDEDCVLEQYRAGECCPLACSEPKTAINNQEAERRAQWRLKNCQQVKCPLPDCRLPDETSEAKCESGVCITQRTFIKKFVCPENNYIDCMPSVDGEEQWFCSEEYLNWARENCPEFSVVY